MPGLSGIVPNPEQKVSYGHPPLSPLVAIPLKIKVPRTRENGTRIRHARRPNRPHSNGGLSTGGATSCAPGTQPLYSGNVQLPALVKSPGVRNGWRVPRIFVVTTTAQRQGSLAKPAGVGACVGREHRPQMFGHSCALRTNRPESETASVEAWPPSGTDHRRGGIRADRPFLIRWVFETPGSSLLASWGAGEDSYPSVEILCLPDFRQRCRNVVI